MQFPLEIPLGRYSLNAHVVFESLAYALAFRLYLRGRRRAGDPVSESNRIAIIAAAAVGAAIGSKLLSWLENPAETLANWRSLAVLMSGKTIVGGLLGGTAAVEWMKRRLAIHTRTGDLFALPIAAGIAIGRIGCFFAGLGDRTYGGPTTLPWGIDFGDGIRRHPTQLYEIGALAALALAIRLLARRPHLTGDLYRLFLTGYLAWRLAIDSLKPEPRFASLTALQWTCLAALVLYRRDIMHLLRLFAKPTGANEWPNESVPTSSMTSPSPSAPSVTAK
ncbi:MAG TPA: prolipoprotein diacylglyceryl transferase family protein [Bryobacteraceae bacterium]|jgi:prolipoprotein diacylglyceryltransferase|nr:prolipoprotein diacylglyceryl transferase family protein [Bryobacteraceae bacterium]